MEQKGAFPSQTIRELITQGSVKNADEKNIRPASLDLTLTSEVYRIEEVFLPRKGEAVRDILKFARPTLHHLSHPLEKNVTYLARIQETMHLPSDVHCICNPKSSTGRIDIQTRIIADGVPRYDTIMPGGYSGELWTLITPKSFPVLLPADESLSQIRFFNGDTILNHSALKEEYMQSPMLWNRNAHGISYNDLASDNDGSLILTVDLDMDMVGWECLGSAHVLDVSKRNHYQPTDFFQSVRNVTGHIRLRQNAFYILYTKERVQVRPGFACEMIPMDEKSGEFRAHYAGFIDPGWGWGLHGEVPGRRLVLEVRPFEDIVLRDGQPISKIRFCRMAAPPVLVYDAMDSNYTKEASSPRLSKHFFVTQ